MAEETKDKKAEAPREYVLLHPVRYNGKGYGRGAKLKLAMKDAAPLLESGHIATATPE